jgi:hypothetical protein
LPVAPYWELLHNWVAISAVRKVGNYGAAPAGKCTVYLDPWKGGASEVYPAEEKYHRIHNYQVIFLNNGDSDTAPTGCRGYILPTPGKPIERCDNPERFEGDKWK